MTISSVPCTSTHTLLEGLHTFDLLSLVKADPETWKIFFVYAENRLTPGKSYMHNM